MEKAKKGNKIPKEKTDRDQSELLLFLILLLLLPTPVDSSHPNLGAGPAKCRLPGRPLEERGRETSPPNSTPLRRQHPKREEPGTRSRASLAWATEIENGTLTNPWDPHCARTRRTRHRGNDAHMTGRSHRPLSLSSYFASQALSVLPLHEDLAVGEVLLGDGAAGDGEELLLPRDRRLQRETPVARLWELLRDRGKEGMNK